MMENAIARLGDKPIVFVMQAYDTNGCFTNLDALIDLQLWTYELAATESVGALSFVTDGLLMFNYARSNAGGAVCGSGEGGGTRFYPEIKATHELMAEKIFGRTMPALCGRPTPALPATSACPTPDPS